ncbi:NACHT, LRR and PYD domains-containing protein 10-like [Hydra vulgaris]|uniref:NACHT, LRR and PYD domains-containing protein 10-like n=1 Tax=Hydra vulgaris TaxID=6087 RepID=A0ABM4BYQ0_HYDVU
MDEVLQNPKFQVKLSELLDQDWFKIGISLNVKQHSLESIRSDFISFRNQEDKAYGMIKKWFNIDKNPTFEKLKLAISNIPKYNLLKEVEDLANMFLNDSSNSPSNICERSSSLNSVSSNPPDADSKFCVKRDTSEMCTALKNYYRETYEKVNEIQPPLKAPAYVHLMDNFVDLCIVNAVDTQRDVVYSFERQKFLEKQMNYTPISYSKIFTKEKSVILISGIAGIGKTWLLQKCLLDWSSNLIWRNVELVFYLECRRLNQYPNISNINELLNVFYKDIINDFKISNHPALFIIDGLDEFKFLNELINRSSSCNYPIVNALTEIQNYKYVVAGRVYAIDQYQSVSTEHRNKLTIQIMGFNQKGIHDYIEKKVSDEKKDVVKETLYGSPIAKAMASVPFYLCSMCKIISDSKEINKNSFLTMTNLYASIFLYFFQNHIIKTNKLINKIIEENSNKKYILNICKVAYELFVENKVIFSEEEIQTFIIDFDKIESNLFGFIEKIETNLGCYYQFAHLTIMEFCASVYAYNCLSIEEILANKKLESCLSMICGLTNKSQNSLLKFLFNLNPSKNSFEKLLYSILDRIDSNLDKSWQSDNENEYQLKNIYVNLFIECFYESQSSFTDEIKLFVNKQEWWEIWIDNRKTSYQTSCENYFVNHYIKSGRKLSKLFVTKNILSHEEKNLTIQCSKNVREVEFRCPIKFEGMKPKDKIEVLEIRISRYFITKKDFEENFLPWINLCEGLNLLLHKDIDFIEEIYEWIRCSNIKWLVIRYRGKIFDALDELKNFITQKNI